MAIIFKANGLTEELKDISLASLQKAVGGYIERVQLPTGSAFYCDEEAKLKTPAPQVNHFAGMLYKIAYDIPRNARTAPQILGDIVLTTVAEEEQMREG